MKKNLKIYYGLLTSAVLAQVIMTVFTLSQNIGYGQKISFLENKKHTLENQINTLRTDFSKKVAIAKLEETQNQEFVAITQVITVNRAQTSLALR